MALLEICSAAAAAVLLLIGGAMRLEMQSSTQGVVSQSSLVVPVPSSSASEHVAPALASVPPRQGAEAIELTFVGDIIFGRYRGTGAFDPIIPAEISDPLAQVREQLRSDVVVGNLETPIVETLPQERALVSRFAFGGTRAMVRDYLRDFSVLSLANNHFFDLRAQGQRESPEILQSLGILPIGRSREQAPYLQVDSIEVNSWKIGFVAVTSQLNVPLRKVTLRVPYVAVRNMARDIAPLLAAARDEYDLLVVVVHWGEEYHDIEKPEQRDAAHRLIDAGADLVIGHHPHVLQAIESYHGGLIAYSLGNFLFEHAGAPMRDSGVLRTRWRRSPVPDTLQQEAVPRACLDAVRFHPVVNSVRKYRHPVAATGMAAKRVRSRLIELSLKRETSWVKAPQGEDAVLATMQSCVWAPTNVEWKD